LLVPSVPGWGFGLHLVSANPFIPIHCVTRLELISPKSNKQKTKRNKHTNKNQERKREKN
jgi:hypothetical protein